MHVTSKLRLQNIRNSEKNMEHHNSKTRGFDVENNTTFLSNVCYRFVLFIYFCFYFYVFSLLG